jgi:hypothetical protein
VFLQAAAKSLDDERMFGESFTVEFRTHELGTRCRVGKDQDADLVAIVAGNHRILDERSRSVDQRHSQGSHVHPGAGAQLEIFRDSAVEGDARFGTAYIDDNARISHITIEWAQ